MKITPEDVRKMNFGKVIADDALTFLDRFSKNGDQTGGIIRLDGQSLFYLLRLLFHMQLYRLYAEMRDPAIDKVIDQLVVLIGKRISPDRINNLVTLFSDLADEPEHTAMDGFSVPFSATNRDAETTRSFQAFYSEVSKTIEDYPDDFRMLIIRLIDLADKLSSVNI